MGTNLSRGIWVIFYIVALFLLILCGLALFYRPEWDIKARYGLSILWTIVGLVALFYPSLVRLFSKLWKPQGIKVWLLRLVLVAMFGGFFLWWSTITPMSDVSWKPEYTQNLYGDIQPKGIVILHNMRDFHWQSAPNDGEGAVPMSALWSDAIYDINQITGMNLYLAQWSGPLIAHTLFGFDFADGRRLIFSAEARQRLGQDYGVLPGFFKNYQMMILAAPEDDIIRLRSDFFHDRVSRYPLSLSQDAMQQWFLTFVKAANQLKKKPIFYNSLTVNCTTFVRSLVQDFISMPLDWRLILNGKLPKYFYDHGLMDRRKSFAEYVAQSPIVPQDRYPQSIR